MNERESNPSSFDGLREDAKRGEARHGDARPVGDLRGPTGEPRCARAPHDPRADAGAEAEDSAFDATDLLLARAVGGDRDALAEIRLRSVTEPGLLDELLLWQADELRLARLSRELDFVADRSEAPYAAPRHARFARLGWAAAAVLAIGWAGQSFLPRRAPAPVQVAGIAEAPSFASADEAFDAYVAKARADGVMVGDVAPPVLVSSRELVDGGGFEVIVVRQVYERRRAPEFYGVAPADDTGRMRRVVIRPRTESIR
ncbi:MAG: hypothetical protein RI967_839 [Planctomycetota bacterium]